MKNLLIVLLLFVGLNSIGQNTPYGVNDLTKTLTGTGMRYKHCATTELDADWHRLIDTSDILYQRYKIGNSYTINGQQVMIGSSKSLILIGDTLCKYGTYNFLIGKNAGRNITTASYNTIIVDSADMFLQNISTDLNFYVDYNCEYLKDKPEMVGYLKAFEDFALGNVVYFTSCHTRKRLHEKLKYYINYHK